MSKRKQKHIFEIGARVIPKSMANMREGLRIGRVIELCDCGKHVFVEIAVTDDFIMEVMWRESELVRAHDA